MKVHLIYMTAGNKEEAKTIGKELITSGLAACVNIVDNMNSMYMWENELQDDNETILIAKTEETRV
jgi:periplasmic divalent cation tolerance protein